jgi:HNH endonuclease
MCDRCVEWGGRTWHLRKHGYYETNLRLHREVWIAAHGPIPDGYHVHHKNGDRTDNRPQDLELITHSEHSSLHAPEILARHRAKAFANSQAARLRSIEELKKRRLKCIICGSTYRSGSRNPTRYCSSACVEKARSGAFAGDRHRCEHCGKVYQATKRVQRYCSRRGNDAAILARANSRMGRDIACAECGKSFQSARSNASFCGRECALRFHSGNRFRRKVSEMH